MDVFDHPDERPVNQRGPEGHQTKDTRMAIQLTWEEKYSVKHQEMDEQHRQIFSIVNELPEEPDLEKLQEIARQMASHSRQHFSDEEDLLKAAGFPQFDDHQKLHEELISTINRPIEHPSEFSDGQSMVSFKLHIFDKVIEHIAVWDKTYIGLI